LNVCKVLSPDVSPFPLNRKSERIPRPAKAAILSG
jgi:hypothetical protein